MAKQINEKARISAELRPLSKGGTNKDGVRIQSRKKNRAAGGAMSKPPKKKK